MEELITLNGLLKRILNTIQSGGATYEQMNKFREEMLEWEAEAQRVHMDNTSVFEEMRESILSLVSSTNVYWKL